MAKETTKKPKIKVNAALPVYHEHAVGIDIADKVHYVAVRNEDGQYEVRIFEAYTQNLQEIVDYLKEKRITTAAMESTGVYYLPLYLKLEENGIEPYLVNARHVKNVTGRKQDDTDAIWLQKLHTCGLLNKSFQPELEERVLRTYVRQRKNIITIASDSVRRMQKALELMNIKLHTVISDILGKTGMAMIEAILDGERNAVKLAELTDPRIKATQANIIKSLEGIWKEEYLFMLQQAYDEYQFYQKQIKACEDKISEQLLKYVAIVKQGDISFTDKVKKKAKKNQFQYPISSYLKAILDVDLCLIPGISEITALELISEIGTDMEKWKSPKSFAAWLVLSPNTKITGGRVISSKVQKKKNRAGQSLRMAASTMANSKTGLGDYHRKMRSKLGGKGAVVATAHKISRIIYTMIKEKKEYNPIIIESSDQKSKEKRIKRLEKQLERLKQVA